ncbi:GNAT family N-acetyltransferase [Pseudomonadota bacterium AL_CKDN230030165-1A_HGKHYDSX7]
MFAPYRIRAMLAGDIHAVLEIQAAVYPADLLEEAAFFANRLALAPQTCRVAERDGALVGYLIAYPWDTGLPATLNQTLAALPSPATTWFVHDCAVAPQAQGLGVAAALLEDSATGAREAGLRRAALVSLAPAVTYWQRRGYRPEAESGALRAKLAQYGDGAVYMSRALD